MRKQRTHTLSHAKQLRSHAYDKSLSQCFPAEEAKLFKIPLVRTWVGRQPIRIESRATGHWREGDISYGHVHRCYGHCRTHRRLARSKQITKSRNLLIAARHLILLYSRDHVPAPSQHSSAKSQNGKRSSASVILGRTWRWESDWWKLVCRLDTYADATTGLRT